MAPAWRWMVLGVGLLLGAGWQLQQPRVSTPVWQGAAVAAAVVFFGLLWWLRRLSRARSRWRPGLLAAGLLAAGGLLGWAWTDVRAAWRLQAQLPVQLEGQNLRVVGVVTRLPQWSDDGVRFPFEIESVTLDAGADVSPGDERASAALLQQMPRDVLLSWYRPNASASGRAQLPSDLAAGQRWSLPVRLRQPHGQVNPHGFDRELWLFEQGLRATGSVRNSKGVQADLLASGVCCTVERWRETVRRGLLRQLGDTAAAGVLAALSIGDQAAIERHDWDVFRSTGVAHLVAISGLHITMLAWLVSRGVSRAWARSRRLGWWLPAPTAGLWCGLVLAGLYALLAGWGIPAQRTLCMLAVVVAWRSLGWHWPGLAVCLLAAVVVVLADPWSLLQPGFWLSFVAVALLMFSGGAFERRQRSQPGLALGLVQGAEPADDEGQVQGQRPLAWHGLVRRGLDALPAALHSQWVATLGLAPWTLLFFQQISVVGLLANAVAVPLVTWVITPLALLGVVWPALWIPAAGLVDGLRWVLAGMASWSWAAWWAPVAPAWAIVAGLWAALLLVAPLPARLRALGLALLVPMLSPAPTWPAAGTYEVLAADIGQGNAVLVRTAGHALLYDTGPLWGSQSDAGERILAPLLRALGVQTLDALVLSHRDTDHTGGARALMHSPGAKWIYSSLESGHALRALAPHQPCIQGLSWNWDGVHFEFIHPTAQQLDGAVPGATGKPNARSCVLRIGSDMQATMLTGDIEREQELTLASTLGLNLRAGVMLVPHHGSRTSSSAAWLQAVAPRWAVIQAGYRNRYGHPSDEVLERYEQHGIAVVRTDSCGSWHWNSANDQFECERLRHPRYWRAPLRGAGPEFANPPGHDNAEP